MHDSIATPGKSLGEHVWIRKVSEDDVDLGIRMWPQVYDPDLRTVGNQLSDDVATDEP